jgi:hypothetical protein
MEVGTVKGLKLAGAGALALAGTLLVASGAAAGPAHAPDLSGVAGKVTLVRADCPAVGCDGVPLRATVAALKGHRVIAATRTGPRGRYVLTLRPGDYTLRARPIARHARCHRVRPHVIVCRRAHRRHVRCTPVEVTVPKGEYVRAPITCHRITKEDEPSTEGG